jgi:hypothetical protein
VVLLGLILAGAPVAFYAVCLMLFAVLSWFGWIR